MPIRWRLTLWFALILSIILLSSGLFLYSLVHHYITEEVDDSLTRRSDQVHDVLENEAANSDLSDREILESSLPIVDEFSAPGIYIQLVNADRDVLVRSHNLGEQSLPVEPDLISESFAGRSVIKTVSVSEGARLRIRLSPLELEHETLIVEVGRSLQHVDTTMDHIELALIVGDLVAVGIAVVSGFLFARRALAPVEHITSLAEEIAESSDMTRQVAYSGPSDEIGRLAHTFDHMIHRLHQTFESQEQFVTAASHDLRGPLAVIQTNLDLLDRNLSQEDLSESRKSIRKEVARMSKIVEDLLLLAEIQSGVREQTVSADLKQLLEDAIEHIRQSAGRRHISLTADEAIWVWGDEQQLSRMIGNLLNNAVKYTSDDGIISVSLQKLEGYIVIEVTDNGIGIEPHDIDRVFDRFYRADKARSRDRGSGLGLAIAKAIAEQHGADIRVTSQPGQGTTFTITLEM